MPICRLIGQLFSWSCFSHAGTSGFRQTSHWWECEGSLASLPAAGRECRKALHLRSAIAMTLAALALCISIHATVAQSPNSNNSEKCVQNMGFLRSPRK